MPALRKFVFLSVATAPLIGCAQSQSSVDLLAQNQPRGRQMPPSSLQCARNDLTSYSGIVRHYERKAHETTVTIRTDADTTETVTVHYGNAEAAFLVNSTPFTHDDWQRVESEPGVLQPGIRIIAWVCLDGKTEPVLDWRL